MTDPRAVVLVIDDLDEHPFTLAEFLRSNGELCDEDARGVRALRPGEVYEGGGGAAATWKVKRIT